MSKLRIHEVAKNLNVPSKEIIDLIKNQFNVEKKHLTSLTDEELNYVSKHYSKQNKKLDLDKNPNQVSPPAPKKASESKAKGGAKNNATTKSSVNNGTREKNLSAGEPGKVAKKIENKSVSAPSNNKIDNDNNKNSSNSQEAPKKEQVQTSNSVRSLNPNSNLNTSNGSSNPFNKSHNNPFNTTSAQNTSNNNQGASAGTFNRPRNNHFGKAPAATTSRNEQGNSYNNANRFRNNAFNEGSVSSPSNNQSPASNNFNRPRNNAFNDNSSSRPNNSQFKPYQKSSFGAPRSSGATSEAPKTPYNNFKSNYNNPFKSNRTTSPDGSNNCSDKNNYGNNFRSNNFSRPPYNKFASSAGSADGPKTSFNSSKPGYNNTSRPAFGNTPNKDGNFKSQRNNRSNFNNPPAPKKVSQKSSIVNSIKTATNAPKPSARIIDTRSAHVDIERYNEKYDKLAFDKMENENTVQKQKITQKSQQRKGKPRNSRKETEAERLKRIALERKAKPITVSIPDEITVSELAMRLKATASEVIKKLMLMGTMASINDIIDFDTASLVAMEFHARVEKEVVITIEERIIDDSDDSDDNLLTRPPVVVVMGHVDHGKTSLLDAIRKTDVIATEAGGITQHIGAYMVNLNGKDMTFLDTPGHEAFTTMRARGAQVTDIAILVVAADDGIMPQTIEAINHAKAANVAMIVAINKMDKPGANVEQVKQQLTEHGIVPEEWGGDVPCIPISAKQRQGIEEVLEMVNLIAEIRELKANPMRAAKGAVIDAKLDKGRGPIATVLVQNGTLNVGDIVVAGTSVGRVRAMLNDKGQRVKTAGPSIPVEITGLDSVPMGGDTFNAVSDEKLARELVEQRRIKMKEEHFNSQTKVTLDNLFDQMQQGEVKELKIIVKADVQGSVEAVRQSLERLTNEEVRVNVIHGAVGAISESDVMLANASNAIIVGFNVRPEPNASANAERFGVDMRLYRVIYTCIDEITSAMKGMLAPKFREVQLGRAECRQVYKASNIGTIAGCYILEGKVTRSAQIRIVRDGIVIAEDNIVSLKRFKDDAKEVTLGFECGIKLEKFNDIKEGDIFEAFIMEEYRD